MSRIAPRVTVVKPSTRSRPAGVDPARPKESWRDFWEQVVVAIILAVLIRGFDAEAFVIPTGSMAPTLMGRHKEVTCPQCGHVYSINASDDTEDFIVSQRLAEIGICVNCRYKAVVDDTPSFKGDRILVMKFPYEFPMLPGSASPRRWDVVVFHYPEKPETNYIKRLVGLPGEDLRIVRGDIQARPGGTNEPFQIQRKPPIHQRAMQMLVFDDHHRPKALSDKPEWARWRTSGVGWKEDAPGIFAVAPVPDLKEVGPGWSELRYSHRVPDPEQWAALEKGNPPPRGPRPTLITDFYSYNTNISPAYYDPWLQKHEGWLQPNWVGDLTVSARVDVADTGGAGKLKLELVEAGVVNRCEIDLVSGIAALYHGETKLAQAGTVLRGRGAHDVEFANVDDRLTLWVDGSAIFDDGLPYEDPPGTSKTPTARDLDPAGVAVRGATARVSDLVLKRDIYYTQDPRDPDHKIGGVHEAIDRDEQTGFGRIVKLYDFLADPAQFASLKDAPAREPYAIRPDHFMMMGDNSPRSSDSRAWENRDNVWRAEDRSSWEVPRSLLIGKAFFVYWPHGKPFGPDIRVNRDVRLPFRPYFERMKWIR